MALNQENRWESHPTLARILKTLLYGLPVVAAAVVAVLVQRAVTDHLPELGWAGSVAISFIGASLTLVVGERLARRALPLVMLLRLSLLFPDQMPNRLGVALRAASPKRLARLAESDPDQAADAENVLALVAALNAHDRRTRGHSERVRAITMLVADELGVEGEDRDKLEWAALLHDIGKMSVPPEILNKAGRPDPDEWAILQGHPAAGADYSSDLHEWLGPWRHAIDQHHEKVDGSGYPLGLAGPDIELSGRIVAVTDAFETMTATRSYKKPMSAQAARAEVVRCSGKHFDPLVVRAMMDISLRRLHGAMGPLSWLTALPFTTGVSTGVRLGSSIVGGAAAPVLAATMAAALPAITSFDRSVAPVEQAVTAIEVSDDAAGSEVLTSATTEPGEVRSAQVEPVPTGDPGPQLEIEDLPPPPSETVRPAVDPQGPVDDPPSSTTVPTTTVTVPTPIEETIDEVDGAAGEVVETVEETVGNVLDDAPDAVVDAVDGVAGVVGGAVGDLLDPDETLDPTEVVTETGEVVEDLVVNVTATLDPLTGGSDEQDEPVDGPLGGGLGGGGLGGLLGR